MEEDGCVFVCIIIKKGGGGAQLVVYSLPSSS